MKSIRLETVDTMIDILKHGDIDEIVLSKTAHESFVEIMKGLFEPQSEPPLFLLGASTDVRTCIGREWKLTDDGGSIGTSLREELFQTQEA